MIKIKVQPKEYIMLYMGVDQNHKGLGKAIAEAIEAIEEMAPEFLEEYMDIYAVYNGYYRFSSLTTVDVENTTSEEYAELDEKSISLVWDDEKLDGVMQKTMYKCSFFLYICINILPILRFW